MANEIVNGTATDSKLFGLNSFRAEFEDGSEHFQISLHCDELDVTQTTRTRGGPDFPFKVKTFTARNKQGNIAILKVFFNK